MASSPPPTPTWTRSPSATGWPDELVDLDDPPATTLAKLAKAKACDVNELTVLILDRPRHEELIAKVRETQARIQLIRDGDVAGVIATTRLNRTVDIYIGIGGAPEGAAGPPPHSAASAAR